MQDVSCKIFGLTVEVALFTTLEVLMVMYSDNVSTGICIFNFFFFFFHSCFITIAIVCDSGQRLQDNTNIKQA